MKNKYQRMSKEEKESLYKSFIKTSFGKEQMKRLKKVRAYGFIGIILAVSLLATGYIGNKLDILTIITSIILIIFSIIFVVGYYKIKARDLNNYAITNKKKTK